VIFGSTPTAGTAMMLVHCQSTNWYGTTGLFAYSISVSGYSGSTKVNGMTTSGRPCVAPSG
jgi:hypothetical protein